MQKTKAVAEATAFVLLKIENLWIYAVIFVRFPL
jgi:hypothetical protein